MTLHSLGIIGAIAILVYALLSLVCAIIFAVRTLWRDEPDDADRRRR